MISLADYISVVGGVWGASLSDAFHDIVALEDWALDAVPQPALAVMLLFPVTAATEARRKEEAAAIAAKGQPQSVAGLGELLHIQQKVGNACGTIAIVHAATNLCRAGDIEGVAADSWLGKFLDKCPAHAVLSSADAGQLLEDDVEIEEAHADAEAQSHDRGARQEQCHRHFTCFVMHGDALWELDGRKETAVHRGTTSRAAFLRDAIAVIRRDFVELCPGEQFVMFALGPADRARATSSAGGEGALQLMSSAEIDPESVSQLMAFGFEEVAVRAALKQTGGSVRAAADRLLG